MRYLFCTFLCLTLIQVSNKLYSQRSVTIQIRSIVDSLPLKNNLFHVNLKWVETNEFGEVIFKTKRKKISIDLDPLNPYSLDSVLSIKHLQTIILYDNYPIDSALANFHIKNNKVQLYCSLKKGILPLSEEDKYFEKKYFVKYIIYGDARPSWETLHEYNLLIAKFLDSKYGDSWRKEVRWDTIGL